MFRENKLTIELDRNVNWEVFQKYFFSEKVDVARELDGKTFKVWIDSEYLSLEALKDDFAGNVRIVKNRPNRQVFAKATKESKGKIYTDLKGNKFVVGPEALANKDVAFIPANFYPTEEELKDLTKKEIVEWVNKNEHWGKQTNVSDKKEDLINQVLKVIGD